MRTRIDRVEMEKIKTLLIANRGEIAVRDMAEKMLGQNQREN